MTQELDLSTIFGEITKTLVANQQVLNEADKTNHNHGDNMVQTFKTARKAVLAGKDKTPAQQLEYAAARLQKTAKSGSGQIYAEGFKRAAQKFEGKPVTPDNIGTLIEALMGSGQSVQQPQQAQPKPRPSKPKPQTSQPKPQQSQGGGDLLSTLLGGLMSAEQQPQQQPSAPQQTQGGGDFLSTLLGGLMGGEQPTQQAQPQTQQTQGGGDLLSTLLGGLMGGEQQTQQSQPQAQQSQGSGDLLSTLLGGLMGGSSNNISNQSNGLDAGDLLSAALKYFAAKQQGGSSLEAIMSALSKSSPLGSSPERTQSGALVIQTLMKLMGNAK